MRSTTLLKQSVEQLGAVGRNLNQIARAMNQGERSAGPGRAEVDAILKASEALRQHFRVVKAVGGDGRRLRIRKATLRDWRRGFAGHLREHGVAANATERAVRGVTKPQKRDGIYRAGKRRASTHWNQQAAAVSREMATSGNIEAEPGKSQMLRTRADVVRGWMELSDDLVLQGQVELAKAVRAFVKELPPVRTEREWIQDPLLKRAAAERDRAVSNWRAFRAQERKLAEQVKRSELDRTRRGDRERPRDRSRDQDLGRTR